MIGKSAELRDLTSAVLGPPLMNCSNLVSEIELRSLFDSFQEKWNQLNADPLPLQKYLEENTKRHRLGEYFENLLRYFVLHAVHPKLSSFGLPIRDGKVTIGEFDLVFGDGKSAQHWEAAIKFYLCAADPTFARSFVGPETHDRLDLKMKSIFSKQLKLSQNPVARKILSLLGFGEVSSSALVRGVLFYPSDGSQSWKQHLFPDEISPQHLRGWWTPISELKVPGLDLEASTWVILPKARWISSFYSKNKGLNRAELVELLQEQFKRTDHSTMVARIVWQDELRAFVECDRGLIVRDSWLTEANSNKE